MGADMHYIMEYRQEHEGSWTVSPKGVHLAPRDYMLFARLAGVRNDWGVIPVAGGRGMPSDRTATTFLAWQWWMETGPAHSESWIDGEEYEEKILGINDQFDAHVSREIAEIMVALSDPKVKYRLVFWFDN